MYRENKFHLSFTTSAFKFNKNEQGFFKKRASNEFVKKRIIVYKLKTEKRPYFLWENKSLHSPFQLQFSHLIVFKSIFILSLKKTFLKSFLYLLFTSDYRSDRWIEFLQIQSCRKVLHAYMNSVLAGPCLNFQQIDTKPLWRSSVNSATKENCIAFIKNLKNIVKRTRHFIIYFLRQHVHVCLEKGSDDIGFSWFTER